MKDSAKIGLALLAGVAAGAIAGILLAPDEGEQTRKKIAKKAKKFEEKVKDKAKEFSEKAKEYKTKAEGYLHKANDVANDAAKTAEGYL